MAELTLLPPTAAASISARPLCQAAMSHTLQEEVWLKFLRAVVTLAEQEEWEMVLDEDTPEGEVGEHTPTGNFKVGCCSSGECFCCSVCR